MRLLKKQKFYIIGLFVCLLSIMLLLTFILTPENIVRAEDEIYTINEDLSFAEDSVIVILDSEISEVNKVYGKSFFGDIDIAEIEDLSAMTGNVAEKRYFDESKFKQILQLHLPIDSKENVIEVIDKIENIDGVWKR